MALIKSCLASGGAVSFSPVNYSRATGDGVNTITAQAGDMIIVQSQNTSNPNFVVTNATMAGTPYSPQSERWMQIGYVDADGTVTAKDNATGVSSSILTVIRQS